MHGNQPKAVWEVADDVIRGEPVPGHVVPKQEQRFQVDMKISFPTDDPDEGSQPAKTATYRWSTYAVDDNGNEIAELDYLQNFQKRYNKVQTLTESLIKSSTRLLLWGLILCFGFMLELVISHHLFLNLFVIISAPVEISDGNIKYN